MTFPAAPGGHASTPRFDALIEGARRHSRRRRASYGALVLALIALAAGLFFLLRPGDGGAPRPSGTPGAPGGAGSSASRPAPGPVRFLRTVTLPRSNVPPAVQRAFAARRYSSAAPREAARLRSSHGPLVLWVSQAYGGGWCEGVQQPRLRFWRLSVSCIWPHVWMRRGIPITMYGPPLELFWGRVPQKSVRSLRLRLGDGSSLSVPIRNGFLLFGVPERVLVHAAPRALLAYDKQGRLVARESFPSPLLSAGDFFGGIRRPPGGAELALKHELFVRETPSGRASIWAAPSFAAPARCTWLQVRRAVYGGGCRRYRPAPGGLWEVVPLRLRIRGTTINLLWGQVGRNVAGLYIRFQDGNERALRITKGFYLYPVPASEWIAGHRPAYLIARDAEGRTLRKRLLFEYTLAP